MVVFLRSDQAGREHEHRRKHECEHGATCSTADSRSAGPPSNATNVPDGRGHAGTAPNRSITIKSPLYEATLDTKGAVATSWILLRNTSPKSDVPIYADGSTDNEKIPLQLISEKALAAKSA